MQSNPDFFKSCRRLSLNILNFQTVRCPIAIKWTVSEEKLVALKDSNKKCLRTKRFNASNIPGVQYYLTIYPNGNNEDNRGEVWVFLQVELGNESKVKVNGKFCIDSADWTEKFNEDYHRTEGCGLTPCETADLFDSMQNLIVDGKLTLTFEGILSVDKEKTDNGIEINLGTGHLGSLFWLNEDKDFTIHVGENAVKVSFTLLQCYVLYIYIFRSINMFLLFIPPFSKQCSKLA